MSTFIDACKRKHTEYTPVWFMRQAGRYQPEYRAIREKVSFLELCKTPELAAEVTVHAVQQLGVDAAILFADILLVLEPLGVPFEFSKDDGPRILQPLRSAVQVDALSEAIHARESLAYVMETVRLASSELGDTPLIGFAGAPFTLAAYAIEGGGSRNYHETKKFMAAHPSAWAVLMKKLCGAIADYLNAQIDAGVQAVQIFDSWVGCLSVEDYETFVEPHMTELFRAIRSHVPRIHFGTGNPSLYPLMKRAGGDVMGVDWRTSLGAAWNAIGSDVAIMGNLDPAYVLGPVDVMKARATNILREGAAKNGHIFNLGHGLTPEASVDQVRMLVDHVHETSTELRKHTRS